MCATCGRGHGGRERPGADGRTIGLQREVAAENERLAGRSRAWLAGRGAVTVNLMSSVGGRQGLPGTWSRGTSMAFSPVLSAG